MPKDPMVQDTKNFTCLLQNTLVEEYDELVEECKNTMFLFIPSVEFREKLMHKIIKQYLEKCFADKQEFFITKEEIERCNQITDPLLKRIFYCLMVQQKLHPHQNGWVRLDWPDMLGAAFTEKEIKNMRTEVLAGLRPQGLEMRVVGSKNPVLCFQLPFIEGKTIERCLTFGEAKSFYEEVLL